MANQRNQKQKLLALLRILQTETDAGQGLTMPQIIERLSQCGYPAERKAVYRDIQAFVEAGFDVRKLPTRPVQYALVRTELDFDDVMMLIDIAQASPFLTDRKANSLVKSLKQLVSERQGKQLARRVHVRGRIRNQNESVLHNVDAIHQALKDKRMVEFLYFSYGTDLTRRARHEGKRYLVTPVKVIYSDGNYYLAAYVGESEQIRNYRIDRMEIVQVSKHPAARNALIANYDVGDFEYMSFGMYSGEPVSVTLRAAAPMMDAVVDRFGRDVTITKATEEYADVLVNVQKSPQFFGWVAGLDGGVTIHTPRKLAAEYKEWLQKLAAD